MWKVEYTKRFLKELAALPVRVSASSFVAEIAEYFAQL